MLLDFHTGFVRDKRILVHETVMLLTHFLQKRKIARNSLQGLFREQFGLGNEDKLMSALGKRNNNKVDVQFPHISVRKLHT